MSATKTYHTCLILVLLIFCILLPSFCFAQQNSTVTTANTASATTQSSQPTQPSVITDDNISSTATVMSNTTPDPVNGAVGSGVTNSVIFGSVALIMMMFK